MGRGGEAVQAAGVCKEEAEKRRSDMRAMAAVLLLGLVLSAGAAPLAVAEDMFESTPKKSPWKEGQVIKAELVWLAALRGGYSEATFRMPDGERVNIELDSGENCVADEKCDRITPEGALEHVGPTPEDHILNNVYLGRQMLITFTQLNWKDTTDGDVWYGITASRVRLDRDPAAPRNTWIIPHQKLRGKIFCPYILDSENVYLITEDGKKYRLVPRWNGELLSFLHFCRLEESLTLEGDFLPRDEEKNVFQTYTRPEEFIPDW